MRLALYQPDIAPNAGTLLRLGACLGVPADIIGPCGFPFSDRALRRAGMDYLEQAEYARHLDWDAFEAARKATGARLVLLTTKSATIYTEFAFRPDDILMVGRESAGVPDAVHRAADACVTIPQKSGRSLNVAVAAAMVVGEALRQTNGFSANRSGESFQ